MKAKYLFGDIVVVNKDEIGVIVKTWEKEVNVKKGNRIRIWDNHGSNEYSDHCVMEDAMYPEWNDRVPLEIKTCCGLYRPTSAADGYWQRREIIGGWEIIGECEECKTIK